MKKSILVITCYMIPFSQTWGQCQRMFFLSDFFRKHDFDVSIVCINEGNYGNFGHSNLLDIKGISLKIINDNSSNKQIPPKDNIIIKFLYQSTVIVKNLLKKIESIVINEPSFGMGILGLLFILYAKNEIFNSIIEKKINTVIISGPPFSFFLLTRMIKKAFPDIKIIMDYRDPWNTYSGTYFSFFFEKLCLKNCDKQIFFNEMMMTDTISKFDLEPANCDFITNGFSEEDWSRVTIENNSDHNNDPMTPLVISYVGSIYFNKGGYRDLSVFFDAFELFQKNKDVLLRFIGVKESDNISDLKKRFLDKIEFIPIVDHKKSLEYMKLSNILLHIHTDSLTGKSVMAGKIFDYVRSGKIIFVISTQENAYCINFVEQHQLGESSLNNKNDILKSLNKMYYYWSKNELNILRNDSFNDIAIFSREYQNSKYLSIIKNL